MKVIIAICLLALSALRASPADWVRAGINTKTAIWGIRGGLQFALHPAGFSAGEGGPRGLIRLGYPTLTNGQYDLINFIAVEPIVKGRKGFSELEKSAVDGKPGKVFWTGRSDQPTQTLDPGELKTIQPGLEELSLNLAVEKFENGAHIRIILALRSDAPNELRLTVLAVEGSASMESCILTATMGNKARARLLQLRDGPVSSLQLFPNYKDIHFADHRIFALDRLLRLPNGDAFVSIQNDENPSVVQPLGRPHFWDYRGRKVIQYWKKPAANLSAELKCAVNARYVYWGGKQPIPGGISFENFELREPFRDGQTFIFGITTADEITKIGTLAK